MKKKILFVLPAFTFGGTVFSTLNMISLLPRDKYEIDVFAMSHQGPVKEYYSKFTVLPEKLLVASLLGRIEKKSNILKKIFYVIQKGISKLFCSFGIDYPMLMYKITSWSIQKSHKYDIVASCQEGDATYCASCFKGIIKIAWFRSEYSIYKNQLSPSTLEKEQKIYRVFDNIVCVSQTTRDDFCRYFEDIENKVLAIHNIQNVDSINGKASESVNDSFEKDVFNIVSVGRIAPQKRFSYIPRIASILKDKHLHFKWYIIGDGNVQGENDKLQMELEKYKVSDVVICMGSKLNPYPYIKTADLTVVPSYYEACPRVVIESKILKTPVVAADFSSAKEFVSSGIDGYVDDINKIGEHIAALISDKELYRSIKTTCNSYSLDNESILLKLCKLFG